MSNSVAQHEKAVEKENEAKQDIFRERPTNIGGDVYTNVAAESLFSMIAVPSNQAIEDHTDQLLNVQLAATALYLAADLRQHELGVEWDGSIRDWLLPGTPADVALCEAITANQSNWPLGMKKPPLKVNLPHNSAAKTAYPTVSFKAWFQPNDTSIKTECAATTDLNALSDVSAKDF
ncbi:hypothetical protein EDB82DRAFT_476899 [Fusarium venenatum]|uniref:uncharacterized protein n=1 Tax=Fusarium venenatum TaxID=56646 RepID=UPI001D8F1365|nr:hypothetical protein EDB82DRAFT_476899 [Fusarium venenatum]